MPTRDQSKRQQRSCRNKSEAKKTANYPSDHYEHRRTYRLATCRFAAPENAASRFANVPTARSGTFTLRRARAHGRERGADYKSDEKSGGQAALQGRIAASPMYIMTVHAVPEERNAVQLQPVVLPPGVSAVRRSYVE